jgi:multidrug efflux pump subunit AcrB
MRKVFAGTKEVVDIDDSVEEDAVKYDVIVDKTKAAENGISTEQIIGTLRIAVEGAVVTTVHIPGEKNPVGIFLRYPRDERRRPDDLRSPI